jgi:nicotinamidase-related amidase
MIPIDKNRAALLVMDFQKEIVGMIGDKGPPLLDRTAALITEARRAKLEVIYVVIGFRPGYPELDKSGPMYAALAPSGRLIITTPGADIAPAVRPAESELVVVKRRVSAFAGSDLELALRAKKIDTLILAGISTSGVVLSTVRQAADADYRIVVVKDCCADGDDEVHRVLTEKVFLRQATVANATDVIAALATP